MTAQPNFQFQIYNLPDLPGRIGKSLEVPPGYRGVVLYPDGACTTFPAGQHRLLSMFARARGQGAGLRAGIVSDQPLSLQLKAGNLLSGDHHLMDLSLFLEAQILDLCAFFSYQAQPGLEFERGSIALDSAAAQERFAPLVRRYAAADLVSGLPTAKLLPALQAVLVPLLMAQGLQLLNLSLIVFGCSEDRVEAAEKAFVLQERLQALEMQAQMAAIENQVQMDDFAHQLAGELDGTLGVRPVVATAQSAESAADSVPPQETIRAAFQSWFKSETHDDQKGLHVRLNRLLGRFKKEKGMSEPKAQRYPKYWWRGRAVWMAFVILAALFLTAVVNRMAGEAPGPDRFGFILAVWTFAVITLLESVKALYQKREMLEEQHWAKQGSIFIDDLTGQDRLQADALVRQQCVLDMENAGNILNDLRSRIYKAGDTKTALKIKTLESKIQNYAEDLQNLNFGQPPYVTDLKISKSLWLKMLDYDEQLLVRASAFNEDAHDLQQRAASGAFQVEQLNPLEGRLDAFRHRFANRSQALKSSPDEQQRYRMKV